MFKVTLALGVILIVFIAESSCKKKYIHPTYRPSVDRPKVVLPTFRPPPRGQQTFRFKREASDFSPLLKEDIDDLMPSHDDELQLNRPERSLDSPSAKRGGSGPRTSSGSRNTGPTHPGYNRRNARDIRLPGHLNPHRPKPLYPRPTFPAPVPRIPILARTARDIQIPGMPKKPTYRDVIIPNWNPNARTNPWNRIAGRHGRSLDFTEDLNENEFEPVLHERQARDIHISGMPKKPTHRDVIIPNWNPNARTNPWNRIVGRHGRSLDFTEDLMVEDELESVPHEREAY